MNLIYHQDTRRRHYHHHLLTKMMYHSCITLTKIVKSSSWHTFFLSAVKYQDQKSMNLCKSGAKLFHLARIRHLLTTEIYITP